MPAHIAPKTIASKLGIPLTAFKELVKDGAFNAYRSHDPLGRFSGWSTEAIPVLAEAWAAQQGTHVPHASSGLTPSSRTPGPDAVWQKVMAAQDIDERTIRLRYSQRIAIDDPLPFAIALLSDVHLGNEHTDYRAARADAELVRDTPGLYAMLLGDSCENWVGQLEGIARQQPLMHSEEMTLVRSWVGMMRGKLLAVVSGNHENRTVQMTSIDLLGEMLREETNLLYDGDELTFTLASPAGSLKMCARHKWRGSSMWNPTYAQEKMARMGGEDWDVAVGGHTHLGTFFRDFSDGPRPCLAILIGTYETDSKYARKLNFARTPLDHRGCGALLMMPDGRLEAMRDLHAAAEFITWARQRRKTS